MPGKNKFSLPHLNLGARLTLSIGVVITLTSLILFVGIYRLEERQATQQIHTQAVALLTEMIVLREWVSSYEGVWTTSPGDYFFDEEDGFYRKTPAMVTKELSDLFDEKGKFRFHITSLKLINPENAPDDFEHETLLQFEQEPVPVTTFEQEDGQSVYRVMKPLITDASCLNCHAEQGYQTGDVRGGLSVLIPAEEMQRSLTNSRRALILSAVSIVVLVMIALHIMVRRMVIAPVGQLNVVAAAVSDGNYDARSALKTNDELELFGETLNQMAANLKASHHSLQRRVQLRTQELNTISDVALIISRAGALEDVLTEALHKVVNVAEASGGVIQLFDDDDIWIAAHSGLNSTVKNCFTHIQEKEKYRQQVQQMGASAQVANLDGRFCETVLPGTPCLLGYEQCQIAAEGHSRFTAVVLNSRQRSLGILTLLGTDAANFSDEFMQLLECIGHQLGVAVENARYHQRIEEIAILEERARISRELHDSLAQTLGWLRIKTEMLEDDLRLGEMERTQTDLASIQRVVRDACYDVRESIDGLRTQPQGGLTATAAAAWIAEFRQRSGLHTDFHAQDGDVRLSVVVEAELLRILQEALTNVRKHAQAQSVRVALRVKGNFAELIIADDGRGFAYSTDAGNAHFGLRIMRERAERLGGTFQVSSTPGQGTKITALLPLFPSARTDGKGV